MTHLLLSVALAALALTISVPGELVLPLTGLVSLLAGVLWAALRLLRASASCRTGPSRLAR
jgi:hypothetical protein